MAMMIRMMTTIIGMYISSSGRTYSNGRTILPTGVTLTPAGE
jgi:hypothetical protein